MGTSQSRAMANQKRADGADLWFVTSGRKRQACAILAHDPHVNLVVLQGQQPRVGVGIGRRHASHAIARKIRELYTPDWKVWFAEEGDPRHGTADDPRHGPRSASTVHAAVFLEINKPRPVLLYEMVKGWLTGTEPELGEMHHLAQPHRG